MACDLSAQCDVACGDGATCNVSCIESSVCRCQGAGCDVTCEDAAEPILCPDEATWACREEDCP